VAGDIAVVLSTGLALALSYNPLTAIFSVPVAAALLGVKKPTHQRWVWAVSVLGFAWLIGDGMRVLARTRDVYDGLAGISDGAVPVWAQYAALAIWAIGGLLIGYVLPVWAGVFVGRRVTHGTGWVAATSVSIAASLALSAIIGGLVR